MIQIKGLNIEFGHQPEYLRVLLALDLVALLVELHELRDFLLRLLLLANGIL